MGKKLNSVIKHCDRKIKKITSIELMVRYCTYKGFFASGQINSIYVLYRGISITLPSHNDETNLLPNRLLAAIPVSDLGDSLDSRHLSESLNLSHGFANFKKVYETNRIEMAFPLRFLLLQKDRGDKDGQNLSNGDDSGYDDYDEEYCHIITENSAPELVAKVEREFTPVDLPELLVITGRACSR